MTKKNPNPYNAEKPWHTPDKPVGEDANALFHEPKATRDETSTESAPEDNHDYKKRYDSVKRHYDSKLAEWEQEKQELIALMKASTSKPQEAPKIPEDIAKFQKEYPELYRSVQSVADQSANAQADALTQKLEELQRKTAEINQRDAQLRIRQAHSDYEQLRNSDEFHTWAKSQPEQIQNWIYKNSGDADLAIRALDFFKAETGYKSSSKPSSNRNSAANMVPTKQRGVNTGEKRVWKESEITKMDMTQYDKYEAEIDEAIRDGRVLMGQ